MDTKLKRSLVERLRRNVAKSLQAYGFAHSKPSFFTRVSGRRVEFVHIHVFSFTPLLRVHLGYRDAQDSFEAVALNGPTSDDAPHRKDFDLSFTESPDSVLACASAVLTFVEVIGLPWLKDQRAVAGRSSKGDQSHDVSLTCKLLGIPNNLFNSDALTRAG